MNTTTKTAPQGYSETKGNDFGTVFFTPAPYGAAQKFYGIAYKGNAKKAAWHHSFRTLESVTQFANSWLEKQSAAGAVRAARRQERAQYDARKDFNAGDIIDNVWGYEQTNVDFYQVIAVGKKFLKLRKIASVKSSDGPMTMTGRATPAPGAFTGEVIARAAYQEARVNFDHGAGSKWDGRPVSYSTYA